MYEKVLEQLGLTKNEAKIFEVLLCLGELSVGTIATQSKIHRRNVYDALTRLIEKGLVFEAVHQKESRYRAMHPDKLMGYVKEKEDMLLKVMPKLQTLYDETPGINEVYIYQGPEGWRNYMMDIVRTADEFYCIGAKGAWLDERVKHFFPAFVSASEKKGLKCYHLFDSEVKIQAPDILKYVGEDYKFLPKEFSAPASVDIFGDRVAICNNIVPGGFKQDFSLTVIVNPSVAEAFRTWFKFMWQFCPEGNKN